MLSARKTFLPLFSFGLLLSLASAGAVTSSARADDDPAEFNKLNQKLSQLYQAKKYEEALKVAEKMHKLRPDDADTIYNTACLHCLVGHKDKAYEWLEKAVKAGYDDADHLEGDADFKTIRGEKRFRDIVKKLREADADDEDDDEAGDDDDHAKAGQRDEDDEDDDEDDADDDDGPVSPQQAVAKINELTSKVIAAAEAKEYKKALKLALEAEKLADTAKVPQFQSLTKYNVACMLALNGEKEKALDSLEAACKAGRFRPDMAGTIEGDSDLESLRKEPRYTKLLESLKKEAPARGGGGPRLGQQPRVEPKAKFEWTITLPKKHDSAKKSPLLIAFHGYDQNMETAKKAWAKAADKLGCILLTPQGREQMEKGHHSWGRDIDQIDEDVLGALDEVMGKYKIDKDKVVLGGFSQGGWVAWSLAMRSPDTFCGVVPICGRYDAESDWDAGELEHLRCYVMLGEDDQQAIIKSNEKAAKALRKAGAKVTVKTFEGVAHSLPDNADKELEKALRFVLDK